MSVSGEPLFAGVSTTLGVNVVAAPVRSTITRTLPLATATRSVVAVSSLSEAAQAAATSSRLSSFATVYS